MGIENLNPVVGEFRHVHRASGTDTQTHRTIEFPDAVSRLPPTQYIFSIRRELLNSLIFRVRDINKVLAIDRDPHGPYELTRTGSLAAPLA